MKTPLGFVRSRVPARLRRIVPQYPDPRRILDANLDQHDFAEVVSVFNVGSTFKTTRAQRYPNTVRVLASHQFASAPRILDIGVSDGSAALALIESLPHKTYYLADKYFEILAQRTTGPGIVFLDLDHKPLLYADDWVVAHANAEGALWPLRAISKYFVAKGMRTRIGEAKSVKLLSPSFRGLSGAIKVVTYDIFTSWPFEKVDLVIVANLLNRVYFDNDKIACALNNVRDALVDGGLLAVIENRELEQSTIFRLDGRQFKVVSDIGAGCDIRDLVQRV